jgi:hypothetical protein
MNVRERSVPNDREFRDFVRPEGGWGRETLEVHVDFLKASGHPVGAVISIGGVRGPDPRDPPQVALLSVDGIRAGKVLLNGVPYARDDFVWGDLRENDHRMLLGQVLAVGWDAFVMAPMRMMIWERIPRTSVP